MRTIYTLHNFLKKLKDDSFGDEKIGLDSELIIDSSIIDWDFRAIKNVTFEKLVRVRNAEINSGLAFYNCDFKKGIIFSSIKCTNFDSTINRNNFSILISSCKASLIQFDANCFLDRAIKIEKQSEINSLCIIETHKKLYY